MLAVKTWPARLLRDVNQSERRDPLGPAAKKSSEVLANAAVVVDVLPPRKLIGQNLWTIWMMMRDWKAPRRSNTCLTRTREKGTSGFPPGTTLWVRSSPPTWNRAAAILSHRDAKGAGGDKRYLPDK
jgi:hypothetical protein